MTYFVHSLADNQSDLISLNCKKWRFSIVLLHAKVGENRNICSHCFIENDVVIDDLVTVKCVVQLRGGLRIEDDVFTGPNVTFTNDPFPRRKQYPPQFLTSIVKTGAFILGGHCSAGHHDRTPRYGSRGGGGDPVGSRWRCGGQPRAHRGVCGGGL